MTTQELQALVEKKAHELAEHAESVRIFVTKANDDDGSKTESIEYGCGNFYAQLGQVQEWLAIQDEYQRGWARRKDAKENEE